MKERSPAAIETRGLILVPALLTLGVTLIRLVGELLHGPRVLFNSAAGGPWSIIGITWLAPIFGIYFALKLVGRGYGPKSFGRAAGSALLGAAVFFVLSFVGSRLHLSFRGRLLYVWALAAVAALLTLPGWSALFRTLLAYAYAARVPVVVVMFFAFWRDWGTHYDAVPQDMPEGLGVGAKFLWLGFFPQLIFWVGFTVLTGMLFGSLAAGMAHYVRPKPQS